MSRRQSEAQLTLPSDTEESQRRRSHTDADIFQRSKSCGSRRGSAMYWDDAEQRRPSAMYLDDADQDGLKHSPSSQASTAAPLSPTPRTNVSDCKTLVETTQRSSSSTSGTCRKFVPPVRGFYDKKAIDTLRIQREQAKGWVTPRSPHRGQGTFSHPYGKAWDEPYQGGHPKIPEEAYPTGLVGSNMRGTAWPRRDQIHKNFQFDSEILWKIQNALRAQSYTGQKGHDLAKMLSRLDKDGSGTMEFEDLRVAFRRHLRITPDMVNDLELRAFMDRLDHEKSGTLNVSEILQFAEDDLNALSPRINKAFKVNPRKPGNKPQTGIRHDEYDSGLDRSRYPGENSHMVSSAMRSPAWKAKPPPKAETLYEDMVIAVRAKISRNTYGKSLDAVVARHADPKTGALDMDAFRKLLRVGFRVPSQVISDLGLISLFEMLRSHGLDFQPPSEELHRDKFTEFVRGVN